MIKLPDDVMQSVEAVAKLNNDLYRWTSRMSYNESWVGEPEGLIKGHVREMEKILDSIRAEVQRLNATAQPVSDGWVKCSERMPEEMSNVLVTDAKDVKDMWWNGKKWDSWADRYSLDSDSITHWMPKPSAPGGQDS